MRGLRNRFSDRKLIDKYNLIVVNNHVCYDGDLEELFYDLGIKDTGLTKYKAKDFLFNEDVTLDDSCNEGDYLETVLFIQDGISYEVQAFAEDCGCGLDYCLAIWNASERRD